MTLATNAPVAFIPTKDPKAARAFYQQTLGLKFESEDPFAIVFRAGPAPGLMLRVVNTPDFTPAPFTIFGWQVDDIVASIKELKTKGIGFLRYGFFEQDEHAVWHSPSGAKVAWFKDPDGNTLSLSQHEP
ncbi:MAG TPA: VOC family protein [Acidobacteriaceae bacterium]|jgi:catechol 2,3-dioxygenase-like lactoylglutathione lyase family enzyme|nr:VOC family protein [Acidobacteriaceae bacterium]